MYLIEATTKSVTVEDLGIFVGVNLPKTISEKEYQSSVCLAELIRQGHLRASRTSLCREEVKPKTQKKKRTLTPPPRFGDALPVRAASQIEAYPQPSLESRKTLDSRETFIRRDELSAVVAEVVDKAVRNTVAALVGAAPTHTLSQFSAPSGELGKPFSRGLAVRSIPEEPPLSGDVPLFIPSGLVPKDSSGGGITVTLESQSSEDLGDSAAALKKLRKGASK